MVKSIKKSNPARRQVKKIYMDYASSSLVDHANPGAIHDLGVKAKKTLDSARGEIAKILGAHADEVVFTSGATESNNLALLGVINKFYEQKIFPHIVTTNIEHASVLEVCKHLENLPAQAGIKKIEVTFVPVEANGIVDPAKIKKALKPNTILVSIMYANNEIGSIQPIREIAKEIRHFKKTSHSAVKVCPSGNEGLSFTNFPLLHTDATQAINYLPINIEKLGVDLMSFNGAKIYGPNGIGALFVKRNTPITSIMFGGDQEFSLRPGTENVVGAVGLAKSLKIVEEIKEKEVRRLTKLRDYFIKKLGIQVPIPGIGEDPLYQVSGKIVLNGDLENRLPNNINITIPKIPSDLLVIELSARGIMASVKSACKSGDEKASHVIQAIREAEKGESLLNKEIDGSIRFSLGRQTTKADIDYTVKALSQILNKLKKWYN